MDKREARRVLDTYLERYRTLTYHELQRLVDEPDSFSAEGPSGAEYWIEVLAVWDTEPGRNLRVLGSIDDGGLRWLAPLSDDFIITPEGSFAGE